MVSKNLSVAKFDLNYLRTGVHIHKKQKAILRKVGKFGWKSYFCQLIFTFFTKKSNFMAKKLPWLAPFAGGYEICHTNSTST